MTLRAPAVRPQAGRSILFGVMLVVATAAGVPAPSAAADRGAAPASALPPMHVEPVAGVHEFVSHRAAAFGETPPLQEVIKGHPEYLRPSAAEKDADSGVERIENNRIKYPIPGRGAGAGDGHFTDPLVALTDSSRTVQSMPSPLLTFAGMTSSQACSGGCVPPDTNGDVGPNNYVQTVNTRFAIWNKAGTVQLAPSLQSSVLFVGLPAGNVCRTNNNGDPVVLYDPLADRWLISQFEIATTPGHQCIAISKTGDPTGAWFAYDFVDPDNNFHDYPHYGVWSDGYYMTDNVFDPSGSYFVGAGIFAFERAKMLVGDPTASYVYRNIPQVGGQLPTDFDGIVPPPPGLPNRIMEFRADEFGDPLDAIRIYELVPDYADASYSTLTIRSDVAVAPFDARAPVTSRNVVEVSGGTAVDAISDRLMFRLAYRNLGTAAAPVNSWTGNFTVNVSGVNPTTAATFQTGVRWFELRSADAASLPVVRDQGTQNLASGNGATGVNNWMGSVAQDHLGEIALGYSQASTTSFANIVIAGRTGAATGVGLNEGEAQFFAAAGAQTDASGRWGDYSAMSVDPTDECTFWYTQEYYGSTGSRSWRTRIGSFVFPSCSAPPRGFLAATITDCANASPLTGATVEVGGGFLRATNASGNLPTPIGLSPGTITATARATGYLPVQNSSLVISDGATTNFVTCLSKGPSIVASTPVTISAENFTPPNSAADPGETVTVNLPLKNIGLTDTASLTATLQPTGGVTAPGAAQNYGVVSAGGADVLRPFTFTAAGACGGRLTLTLALNDGATSLGTVRYTLALGVGSSQTLLSENFDGVTAPALPAGWTTAVTGAGTAFVTSTTLPSSGANDAFSPDVAGTGSASLVSPSFNVPAAGATVSFRNLFNLQSGFDGAVLEYSVDGGATFADVIENGNTFSSGWYTNTIADPSSNPIFGQPAWTGVSAGTAANPTYVTSTIQLPAGANGHSVKLRWRAGTDSSGVASGSNGFRIDSVTVTTPVSTCGVAQVNTAPSVTAPATQNLLEDGASSALGVTVADTETAAASLALAGTSNNTALVPNGNIVFGGSGAARTVTVTPAANQSGSAVITLTVTDAGNLTGTATFTVNVAGVNDPPSFTISGDRSHLVGTTGVQTVAGFVTGVDFGPNESGQAVAAYNVIEASDPSNIVSSTAIANDGTLTYTLSGAGGVASINATLQDNGGTANGGVDTSAVVNFTITVAPGADLGIALTNGQTQVMQGASTSYTIVVSNAGPNTATGATLSTTLPAGLTGTTWTCAAVLPVTCANASGSGSINESVTLATGQSITYTLTGTVGGTVGNNLVTSASIAAPGSVADTNSVNDAATDTDLIVGVPIFSDGFE